MMKKGEKRPLLTGKQVGRVISGISNYKGLVTELVIESNGNSEKTR